VLQKYNDKTDWSYGIYAAATLLNPCLRLQYFRNTWTDSMAQYIPPMIERNRSIWETKYCQSTPAPSTEIPSDLSAFDSFIAQVMATDNTDTQDQHTDFDQYISGRPLKFTPWHVDSANNIFQYWASSDSTSLRQWAFDTLSVPASSAELERVFSQTKRFLTDDRNRLTPTAFEALMCLKQWRQQGLYQMPMELARQHQHSSSDI
jgi:hypothetical protein